MTALPREQDEVCVQEQQKERIGLRFSEVRDQTGRLLFRIASCGIVEVRSRGKTVLVNVWQYLELPEPVK